ncbi:hypothetical protein EHW97_11355 [Aeromicrobium camelliae]|uniref:DUF6542 domain-containing protein n=1 Tax=Aeromicrobium camelliae TaxID=1538144 RepID=A0A3N6WDE8_9ACTN|nr:DUF6542 domain-containing protein [Aeromicrobium camelliae]RQN03022.1 hypothetical protein EHW97_11355 [Aeromicrobium camelliae]
MASALWRAPRNLASHDLTARQAVVLAALAMLIVTALDLIDGRLGVAFGVGFVLVVATVPLAVRSDAFFTAGVFPPLLFAAIILAVAAFFGSALVIEGLPDSAGVLGRALSGTIAFGVPLLVGHALALAVIVVRILKEPA